ncbi:cytochrome P450 27C1-like [Mercenaria mercenaria]|uniref:cytochrome P450 27C1-like n=1 Tax=Mercenaria mercenaria TaxID=6596 RepID=UPI00234F3990|nr:cytochrome P450 27C1-like [Mercenaria mercenaria]
MNPATETLLRRAASQAVSLARQNARCVFTDRRHERAAADAVVATPNNISYVQKTIQDLPGPDGYPIIGTAPEYFRKPNRGQMHEVQRRFHAKYGRIFKERLGPVTNLSIADPKLVEEIFRHEGKYPTRPAYEAWLHYKEMRMRSKGIVSASGEEWRKIRTLLNHRLMKPRQMQEYVLGLSRTSEELAEKLRVVRDQNDKDKSVPNILNLFYAWSIESIGQVLIDERFGCLEHDMPETMNKFVRAIEEMMYSSHQLIVFSNVHKRLNTKIWRTFEQSWDTIIDVAKNILDSKRKSIEERVEDSEENGELRNATLLEHLLASDNLTMEEIYTNMTELLLSGVDTTSNTVAVAMYLLSRHPHALKSIQNELDNLDIPDTGITSEHLGRMPYLKATVKEVLRLFPTVPTNARVLNEDTTVAGYLIPKNTIVMLNTFTMCRDPKEFDRPDEFVPERWLRNEVREFSPFTSLPFGFGARSCVGRRVAEHMVYLSIANIAKRYDLRPTPDAFTVKPFVRTVLTLGDNLPVEFYDR